eukprot:m.301328 g.301328  ORF g.301328 m.301328 type:complete len:187 (+) comp14718_c0_seq1:699-1259(+)
MSASEIARVLSPEEVALRQQAVPHWPQARIHSADESVFPRPIDEADWRSKVASFINDAEAAGLTIVETPADEMAQIEQLLKVAPGFFSTPYLVATSIPNCPNCNRRNSFLDVVATGLKVHDASFLLKVFTGEFGYIMNSAPHQHCSCFQCGHKLPATATKYSAPKLPSDEARRVPGYTFPVYTYRF